jgi:hypothetical protein
MQITPMSQETKVACLNGVKETVYKLSDQDLSVLSSQLMLLLSRQLKARESQGGDTSNHYDQDLLQRLDYPDR